jgi:hypothetical protein
MGQAKGDALEGGKSDLKIRKRQRKGKKTLIIFLQQLLIINVQFQFKTMCGERVNMK